MRFTVYLSLSESLSSVGGNHERLPQSVSCHSSLSAAVGLQTTFTSDVMALRPAGTIWVLYIRRCEVDDVGKTSMRPQKSEMAAYTLLCPVTHFAGLSNEKNSHGDPQGPLPVFGQS